MKAILAYFNTPGYPPMTTAELLKLKKEDPNGLEEIKGLCEAECNRLGIEF